MPYLDKVEKIDWKKNIIYLKVGYRFKDGTQEARFKTQLELEQLIESIEQERRIVVIVERPEGTTYEQELVVIKDIQTTLKQYKKRLGKKYYICDWYAL